MDRVYVEDARGIGQPPDFSVQLRIQSALEEMSFAFAQCIAEAMYTSATTVLYILTEVPDLRFGRWRWLPRLLSDSQKLTGHDRLLFF
jgi:hypothetical protein